MVCITILQANQCILSSVKPAAADGQDTCFSAGSTVATGKIDFMYCAVAWHPT